MRQVSSEVTKQLRVSNIVTVSPRGNTLSYIITIIMYYYMSTEKSRKRKRKHEKKRKRRLRRSEIAVKEFLQGLGIVAQCLQDANNSRQL